MISPDNSSVEQPLSPNVGDIVVTDDFPLGIVLSVKPDYPAVNVASVHMLEDGTEIVGGFPGTVDLSQVHEVKESWDIDRICAAWARFFEMANVTVPDTDKQAFRGKLASRMDISPTSEPDQTDKR